MSAICGAAAWGQVRTLTPDEETSDALEEEIEGDKAHTTDVQLELWGYEEKA